QTSQAKLLQEYFEKQGKEVLLTREPGGPKISEQIRNILLSNANKEMLPETEMLLYMASRSQHTGEWIIPMLKRGKIVISDRYYDSTWAYQGVARNLNMDIIRTITKYATYGLVPDITILIDLPASIGLSRIAKKEADRLENESLEFHKKVRKAFLDIAKQENNRYIVVDGTKSIPKLHKEIIEKINDKEGRNE
ncbi:MAG TPA: dTMP kinase, partial [Candidatus Cloacimonas sp.]|nr:dTMP kinase [Candidatus Cloacimonas sp.]